VAILQNFFGFKVVSGFCFKNFHFKFTQVSKIDFKVFSQSLGKQAVSFGKVSFCSKVYFLQSQVFKIGFKIFSKSFSKFSSGFSAWLIFSSKFVFL